MRLTVARDAICASTTSATFLPDLSRSSRSFDPSCRRTTTDPPPLMTTSGVSHDESSTCDHIRAVSFDSLQSLVLTRLSRRDIATIPDFHDDELSGGDALCEGGR